MNNVYLSDDKNFINTAKFFLFFHFDPNTSVLIETFFSWCIFAALLLILALKYKINFLELKNFILLAMFALLFGAYAAQFSKELVVFFFLSIIFMFSPAKLLNKNLALFVLGYGIFFRSYWILIFLISVLFTYVVNSSHLNKFMKLLLYLATVLSMEISYNLMTGNFLSDARYSINSVRDVSLANTMINNPLFNTSIFTDFFNFLYGLVNVFVPIDGINSSNEILYYVWICTILFLCIKYLRSNEDRVDYKFLFILSVFTIQSFFEPDAGSMLRHQIVLAPMLLLLINNKKKEDFNAE